MFDRRLSVRSRLLASVMAGCFPAAAIAADTTVGPGQTVGQVQFSGSDHVTVASGGTVSTMNQAALVMTGDSTGVVIDNAGLITVAGNGSAIATPPGTPPRSGPITITNTGTITSANAVGVFLGGATGPVTITNSGTIGGAAAAIVTGSGNDTLNLSTGSELTGDVNMGAGVDTVNLAGSLNAKSGSQIFGDIFASEVTNVNSGYWTLNRELGTDQVNVAAGATLELDSYGAAPGEGGFISSSGDILTIVNNGAVIQNTDDTRLDIYADSLHLGGAGTLELKGGGAIQFGQNVTLTGATTITDGLLVVTGDAIASPITVASQGTLRVGAAYSAPDADGFVNIVAGGGTTGSLSGNVVNNGAVIFDRSNASTYAGAMSGTGALTKTGSGVLTLAGANTYTGATNVAAGGLVVSGSVTGVTNVASGATLEITSTGSTRLISANNATVINAGTIETPSLTTGTAASISFNSGTNTLSNSGVIRSYNGHAVRFGGAGGDTLNLYTGSAITGRIEMGGGSDTVNLAGTSTSRTTSQVVGDIFGSETLNVNSGYWTLNSEVETAVVNVLRGATLEIDKIGAGPGQGGFLSTQAARVDVNNSGKLVVHTDDTRINVQDSVLLRGIGGVELRGGGVLHYGDNFQGTGETTITDGTVVVTRYGIHNSFHVGAQGTLRVGAAFSAPDADGYVTIMSGGGQAGSLVSSVFNDGRVIYDLAVNITHDAGIFGAGALMKDGTGTLVLLGDNTYTGLTTVLDGTLQVGGSLRGSIVSDVLLEGDGVIAFGGPSASAYGGDISGTGSLLVNGGLGSNLIYTGTATHTGGTQITSGSGLYIGDGGTAGSLHGNVVNDGWLIFNRSDTSTFSGSVTGTGAMGKIGAGTLIVTGDLASTQGVSIGGGVLQVGNGDTTGSISGSIENFGTLIFNRSDDHVHAGVISGSGAIVKNGGGKLTLLADNAYNVRTTINSGILEVGGGGTTGSIHSDVVDVNNGTLAFNRADAVTFWGHITGAGGVTKSGAGVLTLSGATTYTGATTVNGGGLVVSGPFASSGVSLASGASLTFTGSNAQAYGGVVSGAGNLVKAGAGVLTLSGANTHTGGTNVTAGGLVLTGSVVGPVILAPGTSLNVTSTGAARLVTGNGATVTNAGLIETPGLTTGSQATVNFTGGNNTLNNSGVIRSYNGSAIRFAGGADTLNLATGSSIIGRVDMGGGADVINLAGTSTTKAGSQTLGYIFGSETLNVNSGYWTLNREVDADFVNVSSGATLELDSVGAAPGEGGFISGNAAIKTIVNSGAIVQNTSDTRLDIYANDLHIGGSGTVELRGGGALQYGANTTLTGATTVTNGLLVVTGDNIASAINVGPQGTLRVGAAYSAPDADGFVTIVSGGGTTGSVASNIANNGAVIFDRANASTYGGVISGAGTVTKSGAGVLTLSGANTYTGATTVNGGGLVISTPFASSGVSLASGAGLTFTGPNALTYAGVVSGAGGLTKSGSGVVTLSGANTYTGATTVSAGSLAVTGSIASQSVSLASGANLTFASSANQTFGGVISGEGALTKTGAGDLTLTGASGAAGGTSVTGGSLILATTLASDVTVAQGGTLQIGTGGTSGHLDGDLVANGTVIFNRSDDYVFAGDFSGGGSLIKRGAGLLTLDGLYTFSGSTSIEAGTIKITQLDAGGSLVVGDGATVDLSGGNQTVGGLTGGAGSTVNIEDATLTINQQPSTTPTVFNGTLAGDGALILSGGGILDLAGTNTYTGPTTVNGGTLKVNGSISSPVTVNDGGTLGGAGTIGGAVTIGSGGSLSPGNSPGVTTIAGPLTLAAGASMIVEVDPTATIKNDRVNVTGGSATIVAGAKLDVRPLGAIANYDRVSDYVILTATGGVNGTFGANVTSTMALLTPSVSYSTNEVRLRLIRNDISFESLADTENQAAVAAAAEATGPSGAAYGALIGQDEAGARAGYDALSGELYGTANSLLIEEGRHQRSALLRHAASSEVGAWASLHNGEMTSDAGAGFAEGRNRSFGFTGGGQMNAGAWTLGFALGFNDSDITVADRSSVAGVETLRAGAYGGTAFGAWRVRVGAEAAKHAFDARRGIEFPTVAQAVAADYDGSSRQLFGEIAYPMDLAGGSLEPFVEVAGVWAKTDAFAETGGPLGLSVAEEDRSLTFATVGARFSASWETGGGVVRPKLSVAWRRASGDIEGTSTAAFGTSSFTVTGASVAKGTALIDAGVGFDITPSVTGSLAYSGALSSDAKDNAVRAGFFVRF